MIVPRRQECILRPANSQFRFNMIGLSNAIQNDLAVLLCFGIGRLEELLSTGWPVQSPIIGQLLTKKYGWHLERSPSMAASNPLL